MSDHTTQFDLRGPVERRDRCNASHPDGLQVTCTFPAGHEVHWDGVADLWLTTGRDTFARGEARGRQWAIDTLRERARVERDGHPNSPTMWAVFLSGADFLEHAMAAEEANRAD